MAMQPMRPTMLAAAACLVVLLAAAGAAFAQVPASAPGVKLTQRDSLKIVGSTTMRPHVDAIVQHLDRGGERAAPEIELKGSTAGIQALCAGVGVKHPDIVVSSRRIRHNELEICDKSGVGDLIEVRLGFDAVVLVMQRSDVPMALELSHLYRAVAAELPKELEFEENRNATWNQIDDRLPKLEIRILVPEEESGTRSVFDDIFLEGGCRYDKSIRSIFDAEERVRRCTTIRRDGHVVEVPEPYAETMLRMLAESPAGTIAAIDYDLVHGGTHPVTVLPVEGVQPTPATIALHDYVAATAHYLYIKRAHIPDARGVGVVEGIRAFMWEATSDRAIGPGGYLPQLGLIALSDRDRAEQQRNVQRLRPISIHR